MSYTQTTIKPKSGTETFVGVIFYQDSEVRQDIDFEWNEVEKPGFIDVEFDFQSIVNRFENYLEEYPCGAPKDLFEQCCEEIERWMSKSMPGVEVRKYLDKSDGLFSQLTIKIHK